MTKTEKIRITGQIYVLSDLGFTDAESEALRRISNTLQRWHELECGTDNWALERIDGKPYMVHSSGRKYATSDRETGARKRLSRILLDRLNRTKNAEGTIQGPALSAYIQTDPRGAALYILRPGDVPDGQDVESYYSRGVCVY